jgi:hypothetical protein
MIIFKNSSFAPFKLDEVLSNGIYADLNQVNFDGVQGFRIKNFPTLHLSKKLD